MTSDEPSYEKWLERYRRTEDGAEQRELPGAVWLPVYGVLEAGVGVFVYRDEREDVTDFGFDAQQCGACGGTGRVVLDKDEVMAMALAVATATAAATETETATATAATTNNNDNKNKIANNNKQDSITETSEDDDDDDDDDDDNDDNDEDEDDDELMMLGRMSEGASSSHASRLSCQTASTTEDEEEEEEENRYIDVTDVSDEDALYVPFEGVDSCKPVSKLHAHAHSQSQSQGQDNVYEEYVISTDDLTSVIMRCPSSLATSHPGPPNSFVLLSNQQDENNSVFLRAPSRHIMNRWLFAIHNSLRWCNRNRARCSLDVSQDGNLQSVFPPPPPPPDSSCLSLQGSPMSQQVRGRSEP